MEQDQRIKRLNGYVYFFFFFHERANSKCKRLGSWFFFLSIVFVNEWNGDRLHRQDPEIKRA